MRSLTFALALLLAGSLAASAARAADSAPALAGLTYSGEQSALAELDRDLAAAGLDPAKLAALETRLLALLRRANTTFAARQAICQRLGALLAQPAPQPAALKLLSAMLADDRLSDLARLALDPTPGDAIDSAFTAALGKTSGRARLGLIDSIARRRVAAAVPALTALLANRETASAAAIALGHIGTTAAETALRDATLVPPDTLAQARLQAASRLPAADARRILRDTQNDARVPAHLRAAAFRQSLALDPDTANDRVIAVLDGTDWTFKQAALESLANGLSAERARALAAKLPSWDAPTQAGAIAALARAGHASATPAIVAATKHASAEVRAAAFAALGFLTGDRDTVTLLARAAAGDTADAKTARQSLARLAGPDVSAAILAGAENSDTSLRVVLLEQLALRNMTEGIPLLLKCRTAPDASIRAAAVGALGDLASFAEQTALLDWATAASDDTEQSRALRALVNVTLRAPAGPTRGRAIYATIEAAQPTLALRLLPALPRLGGEDAAACAARLASGSDPKVAAAAADALGRWSDDTALSALVTVVEKTSPPVRDTARDHALRQLDRARLSWRPALSDHIARLLAASSDTAHRRSLLTLLARANDAQALRLAEDLARSDSALADDARYAAGAIAASILGAPKLRASPAAGIANATDGKTSTRWSAPSLGEEWIEIDFRQSRPLRRVTLDQTGRADEFPEHYEVYVTDDPRSPGAVVAQGRGQRSKTIIDLPASARGRYLVIKNTAERGETPWAVCELHVD